MFNRGKIALLLGCLTLVLYLPVALRMLVGETGRQLGARAEATPLLIGAKGSPLELALNSLYFETKVRAMMNYEGSADVRKTGLASAIPLYVRFESRGYPIVGTTLDYFEYRGLRIARGTQMQLLGDCVVGATVADQLELEPGDSLVSSSETVFDLAGVYPLKMHVTGILAPSGTPDDGAVFADIKTTWIIEGLAHGHVDLAEKKNRTGILKQEGEVITANASVVQFNEVTDDNLNSFHFHGDLSSFPLTALIAIPKDVKSGALLMGRYVTEGAALQLIVPAKVMDKLLATILTVEQYVSIGLVLLAFATVSVVVLVFLLSLKLRRREIETLHKIGGQRTSVFFICAIEIVFTLAGAFVLTGLLVMFTQWFGGALVRLFL